MNIHKRTLANGLRIQAVEMPGTNVATTLILAGAGSRYETLDIAGISHFLEHMFFKGAEKYPTPKSVAVAVDSFGGEFNAFTGKEYAGYYVKSGAENLEKSLDVLSDMLLKSKFHEKEIDHERGVILEEMAMYLDMPTYQISWDFERLVFGDQPLGRDQIGTRELIENVNQDQFFQYQKNLYSPDNVVITIAGAVSEKDLDLIEKYFQMDDRKKAYDHKPFDPAIATEQISIREKKTEQYHISFGVKAPSERDDDFPTLKVLAVILGGNMSSRMFQNIREKKGLCYSIRTTVDDYTDTGLITTSAGVRLADALPAAAAIRAEYDNIAQNGVTNEEFENAKNYLYGKTDLTTEDTEDVAHHFGKMQLLYGDLEDYKDWKKKVRGVKKEAVEALAKELFQPQNFRLAGIGPKIEREALEKILA